MSLRLALMIVYFLVMNSKRCKTRIFAIAAGYALRQVKVDRYRQLNENCEKYKADCRDALMIIVCDQNNILLRDTR